MGGMAAGEPGSGIGSFVAIGDSFTEGLSDPDPGGGYRGWADRVADVLAQSQPGFRYANLAIRGKLLDEVLAEQLPRAVEMAPDLVGLAAGGNDILRGSDVDTLAAHFEPGVAKLQAAGCRVVIFTGFDPRVFPVIRWLRGRIAAYDMHLRGIADDYGCDLVDLWSMRILNDTRAWSPDRLHLTAEGHRRVALRTCEVLGIPVTEDWRAPLPPIAAGARNGPSTGTGPGSGNAGGSGNRAGVGNRAQWLAARRQDGRWAREYAMPWVRRRVSGGSSGDGLCAKRPELLPLLPAGLAVGSATPSAADGPGEVGQDLF
jgi:lysophospholipase L1-like esterase